MDGGAANLIAYSYETYPKLKQRMAGWRDD
jgi:hypothetical protein